MIQICTKWQHRDGDVVFEIKAVRFNECDTANDYLCVWYKDQQGGIYVRTEKEFLESFKPVEPIYEFQWLWRDKGSIRFAGITDYMTTEESSKKIEQYIDTTEYFVIPESKRERIQ